MSATEQASAVAAATREIPNIPRDQDGPVFQEPWQAQAFAMAVTLQARGLFAWSEWAAMLGDEIRKAQAAGDPDMGATYYHHWLATLERMLTEKDVTSADVLGRTRAPWDHAAGRTPHGQPIELRPEDYE